MSNLLPGIYSIEKAPAATVIFNPETAIINGLLDNVSVKAPFTPVCIEPMGKLAIDNKVENGQEVQQITLTYITEHKPDRYFPCVYRLTDANEQVFLMGTNEPPYPMVTWKNDIPDSPTGRRAYTVTVQWKTTIGLISLS